ncbi:SDR family oxidoreductase [Candidatus Poribacteria bacterium]|nr:SDR family oxidoreductase [Candidatus Poribacteria bacterium]
MDLLLRDKVALVTGAGSGIGRTTALMLAEEGVRIGCADLFKERAEETVEMIRARGGPAPEEAKAAQPRGEGRKAKGISGETTAIASVCDVTNYGQVAQAVADTLVAFGRLDILVNSAGVSAGGLFMETEPESWSLEIGINLVGTMNCCHAAAPHMITKGYGKIVNIASDAGRVGEKRLSVYGASKGGVLGFTKCLALELARYKINVNVVSPGVVKSPMTSFLTEDLEKEWAKFYPLRRLGVPEDVANMIVFLCSDRTSWMTGQTVSIDGGFSRI